jgi:hypothetical protein
MVELMEHLRLEERDVGPLRTFESVPFETIPIAFELSLGPEQVGVF